MERNWKLGDDLSAYDNVLDGFTFDDIIMAVHCNCRNITPEAVKKEVASILESRLQDMHYLIDKNMDEIIAAAK